jgi:hypothetical protein
MTTKKQAAQKDKAVEKRQSTTADMPQPWTKEKEPATRKGKKAAPLTLEQRVERIEKGLLFLGAKLRTHGIHLDADTQEDPEPQEGEEV